MFMLDQYVSGQHVLLVFFQYYVNTNYYFLIFFFKISIFIEQMRGTINHNGAAKYFRIIEQEYGTDLNNSDFIHSSRKNPIGLMGKM